MMHGWKGIEEKYLFTRNSSVLRGHQIYAYRIRYPSPVPSQRAPLIGLGLPGYHVVPGAPVQYRTGSDCLGMYKYVPYSSLKSLRASRPCKHPGTPPPPVNTPGTCTYQPASGTSGMHHGIYYFYTLLN